MVKIIRGALSCVLLLCLQGPLFATNYYVDSSASDDSGIGSQADPKKYINSAIALMSVQGGDTVWIQAGEYADIQDRITQVVNGTPAAYNTIKAVVDGSVTIKQRLGLSQVGSNQASYVQFEGLNWRGQFSKGLVGHHIKIKRCGFEGGPLSGNTTNLTLGTNNQSPGASQILIEDSWFYGTGGRYELQVFNSEEIVIRRALIRHDNGWCFSSCGGSGPPEAGLVVYSSRNIQVQNLIVIDSNQVYEQWEAAVYIINNTSNFDNINTVIEGAMAINNRGTSFKYDGSAPVTASVIQDSMVYGSGGFAVAFTGLSGSDASLRNLTFAEGEAGVFHGWTDSTNDLVDSIIVGSFGLAINSNASPGAIWTHSFNNCSNNGTNNCPNMGETSYDAYSNGLLYPTRIEAGSLLESAGLGGERVGATITKKLGLSGSLYNEPGFDQETNESLWPWPHEVRIKQELCDDATTGVADRGWCATNLSLTEHIWGLLGNGLPGDLTDTLFENSFES